MRGHIISSIVIFLFSAAQGLAQSSLPKIYLEYNELSIDQFNPGSIRIESNGSENSLKMTIRHRGATSTTYDKASYAIKLMDENGNKTDASLLGMRNDNYWILDAMASDMARMRNRVSMDLWLAFSTKPYYQDLEPKCINGYNGKFVEVFVNNQPQGIYCLSERIDRKQLKLKKYSDQQGIRGVLYKCCSWAGNANVGNITSTPDNDNAQWDSWEVKYPDIEDEEPITWQPLYDLMDFVKNSRRNAFAAEIESHIDLPVFIDYMLFCQLISARDNTAKNTYISYYDIAEPKALISPWDIDHSWGRQYNGTEETTTQILFNGHNINDKLYKYYPDFDSTMKARWAELRKTYFNIEYIDQLFDKYFKLFAENDIYTKEKEIWDGHNGLNIDIEQEQKYIHDWVIQRLAFLDEMYDYKTDITTNFQSNKYTSPAITYKTINDRKLYIVIDGVKYDILGRKAHKK